MNLFQKLGESISANIHSAIEKNENPSVMADYYVNKAEVELETAKKDTSETMADRKAIERDIEKLNKQISEMQKYAETAMSKGVEEDAKSFLEKKLELTNSLEVLQNNLSLVKDSEQKMINICERLSKELETLKSRKTVIKGNVSLAKTQEKINKYGINSTGAESIGRLEEKAKRMIDTADSSSELNEKSNTINALVGKYKEPSVDVAKELESLRIKYNS